MINTIKLACEYWDLLDFYIWTQNWRKVLDVCDNKLDPLLKEHPILGWIGYLILFKF